MATNSNSTPVAQHHLYCVQPNDVQTIQNPAVTSNVIQSNHVPQSGNISRAIETTGHASTIQHQSKTNENIDLNQPSIPISHLTAGNAYPSLNTVPSNIAKSFAPIYVQPQILQSTENDIYTDYVQNPYNLTLRPEDNVQVSGTTAAASNTDIESDTQKLGVGNNMFQSANYFTSDGGVIPPGSEMLFGGP